MSVVPKGYKQFNFPTRSGQSADIYSQLAGGLQGGLPDVLKQLLGQAQGQDQAFAPIEQQAQNFYQQQLAPQIAQRYAGTGISGSSGMQNSLAQGASNLSGDLAAQRRKLMQQSMSDVLGLGEFLLGNPDYETYFGKGQDKQKWWQKAAGVGLPILGGIAGGIFGGPAGAGLGYNVGSSLGNAFQ